MLRYAIIAGVIALAVAATGTAVYAASLGEHIEPLGHLKYAVSAEYNHIIDRDFEGDIDNDATTAEFTGAEIDASHQAYAKLAIGLTDSFNLYTKLGAADMELTLKEQDDSYDIETDFGFLWGFGVNGAMEIHEGAKVGLDVQGLVVNNDLDTLKLNSEAGTNLGGEIENFEFQVALYLYKEYQTDMLTGKELTLTPYLAGVYDYYRSVTNGNANFNVASGQMLMSYDFDGDDTLGVVVGCNGEINEQLDLNVEGRFVSETAISTSLVYRF